jgi:hypothetical protein
MIKLLIVLATIALLMSCQQRKTRIDYGVPLDTIAAVDERLSDTGKMLVSELPIKFDSTNILLFAIREMDISEQYRYKSIGEASVNMTGIASPDFNNDHIFGDFINVVFQNENDSLRRLTSRKIRIRSVHFLREVWMRTKKGYLLYIVVDKDSNNDHKLDFSDIESLYISNVDGSSFTKLTTELHELYDWNLIKGEEKIYFRTLEDYNRDGELDNRDKFHYYVVKFAENAYAMKEYNPIHTLN